MAESGPAAQAASNLDWQRCPSRPAMQARVSDLFLTFLAVVVRRAGPDKRAKQH